MPECLGEKAMKKGIICLWMAMFLISTLWLGSASAADEAKITVLNPQGTKPPIRLIPMAQRLDSIEGKTIYIINIGFGETFLPETQKVLAEQYPQTNWVLKRKSGSYFDDDPALWKEIKEKGHAMIMGVGH